MSKKDGFTKGEGLFLLVVGRLIQAFAGLVWLVGIASVSSLIDRFHEWQQKEATFEQLMLAVASVTIPVLGATWVIVGIEMLRVRFRGDWKSLEANRATPWLADPQWASGKIQLSNRPMAIFLTLTIFSWFTMLLPLVLGLGIFPLQVVALVLAILILLLTWFRWKNRSWGEASLELETLPGVIGGSFAGICIIPKRFPEKTFMEGTLTCWHTVTTGYGQHRKSHRESLWSSSSIIYQPLAQYPKNVSAFPIRFEIPANCPASSVLMESSSGYQNVVWQLRLQIQKRPGSGASVFSVPVFSLSNEQKVAREKNEDVNKGRQQSSNPQKAKEVYLPSPRVEVVRRGPVRSIRILLTLLSLFFLLAPIAIVITGIQQWEKAEKVVGHVIAKIPPEADFPDKVVVEYNVSEAKKYEVTLSREHTPIHEIGKEVELLYLADAPARAMTKNQTFQEGFLIPPLWLFISVAISSVLIAAAFPEYLRFGRRRSYEE